MIIVAVVVGALLVLVLFKGPVPALLLVVAVFVGIWLLARVFCKPAHYNLTRGSDG